MIISAIVLFILLEQQIIIILDLYVPHGVACIYYYSKLLAVILCLKNVTDCVD